MINEDYDNFIISLIKDRYPAISHVTLSHEVSTFRIRVMCTMKYPISKSFYVMIYSEMMYMGSPHINPMQKMIDEIYSKVILDYVNKVFSEFPNGFQVKGLATNYSASKVIEDEVQKWFPHSSISAYKAEEMYKTLEEAFSDFGSSIQKKETIQKTKTALPQGSLKKAVPGLDATVSCPEHDCEVLGSLWSLIQHMNDHHKWKFNAIADWLETLDVDIKFKDAKAV